ncbi:MAG: ABC transporter permease [Thermogemmatispora sp.]|uniref:ABC transporter permease n=1 Tax=Thermogemmatispora sp. TaxID=1968838 RepID=UPI002628A3D1|nr:ABC transporter permease [Thermogemmatispora sp.]MBX5455534.1 ABC transporter permease [Thermogemmatispora sp.]
MRNPSSVTSREPAARRSFTLQRRQIQTLLFQLRAFVALIILVIIFSMLSPDFLTLNDLTIVAEHVSINALLAIGQSFVILTAGIDLSVGSIVGLTAMVAGYLISQGLPLPMFGVVVYFNVWVVILIGLLVGIVLGLVNGLVITRLSVAPFIATLGMLYAARGLALLTSNGATFPDLGGDPSLGNTGFPFLGTGNVLGVPMPIWLMILFGVVASFVASRTPFGRQVYAIGGNERAAQLSGIRVHRVKLLVYVISGFCAAMTGLVIASQLQAAQPATGESYELNAIAAVVLGGTSLFGGRGTILGSIIGAFVIGVLSDGLVLIGVSEFWQMVIKGAVIVLAVIIDQLQQRWQKRAALA